MNHSPAIVKASITPNTPFIKFLQSLHDVGYTSVDRHGFNPKLTGVWRHTATRANSSADDAFDEKLQTTVTLPTFDSK